MKMQWFVLFCVVVCSGLGAEKLVIDRFSDCVEKGGIPCGWHASQKKVEMFSVQREGDNHFVRIRTDGGNTSIGKQSHYDIRDYPFLSWSWRAHKLPQNADERIKKKADSGAGVYVIFKGRLWLNKVIKYVWSTSLPVGTVISSPFNSRAKVVVLQSGQENIGRWVSEKVNVYKDYQKVFGGKPPLVEGIGFMSDGHETKSTVKADYDNFVATKR